MYYLKKTEKRDFWPSRTPRSFEIETSNFCYFQIRLTKYSKNFFIELACREHRFSHTRFSRFRPKSYKYMFIGLANVKLDFLILSVRSIFSCREDASPVLASLVGLVLPCGLASPLISQKSWKQGFWSLQYSEVLKDRSLKFWMVPR